MAILKYKDGFNGTYVVGDQTLRIGSDAIKPYDMTYGALASCLYATFLGVSKERGLIIISGDLYVDGTKRSTVPTTLEHVIIEAKIETESEMSEVEKAFDEATKRCSMFQTIAKVAEMEWHVYQK